MPSVVLHACASPWDCDYLYINTMYVGNIDPHRVNTQEKNITKRKKTLTRLKGNSRCCTIFGINTTVRILKNLLY